MKQLIRTLWILLVGFLLVGCPGEDLGEGDAGQEDAGEDVGAGGEGQDIGEGDVSEEADAGETDAGEEGDVGEVDAGEDEDPNLTYDWPCPAGHREGDHGECERVPTLMVAAFDSLSGGQTTRSVLVSGSSSPTDGRLPRETLAEGERCRVYGELEALPEVERYDAGPVTIWGLNVTPATFMANLDAGSVYSGPSGLPVADAYPAGALLNVQGVGTEAEQEPAWPAFEVALQTVEPGQFNYDGIEPGEDLTLTWTPSDNADVVRIDVETRNLGEDGIDRRVVCEVVDTGSYTIPAELTAYLVEDAGTRVVSLYQSRTHRIQPEGSQVLIQVSATNWMRVVE